MLTWDTTILPYAGMGHSIVAGAIESPRSISNEGNAIDVSGGGYWKMEIRRVQLFGGAPDGHAEWLKYRAELDGGSGKIAIPIINDIVAPAATAATFSDGALFSDGAAFSSSNIVAEVYGSAQIAAGSLTIKISSTSSLIVAPYIFSIRHPNKSYRAYQVRSSSVTATLSGGSKLVSVTIRPTIREALVGGELVNFSRPKCVFRLAAGASMPWDPEKYWHATPTVTFYEAMR